MKNECPKCWQTKWILWRKSMLLNSKTRKKYCKRIVVFFLWSVENNKLKRTSALMGPGKKLKKWRFKLINYFLSHIICWYLNYQNQHVLVLNFVYIKGTNLYNIVGVSRYVWFWFVNRGIHFKAFVSCQPYRVHTCKKIKDG